MTSFDPALPTDRVQGGGSPATDMNTTNARVNTIAGAVTALEQGGGGGGGGGSAPTRAFLPASQMVPTNGAPPLVTNDGDVPGIQFWEVAQGQGVGGLTLAVDTTGWATARLDLHWFKRTGGSGNLLVGGRVGAYAAGDVIGAGGAGDPASNAAGAVSAYKVSSLGVFSGGPGALVMRMYRFDTAAGDTLGTVKIGVLGLSLTKLS